MKKQDGTLKNLDERTARLVHMFDPPLTTEPPKPLRGWCAHHSVTGFRPDTFDADEDWCWSNLMMTEGRSKRGGRRDEKRNGFQAAGWSVIRVVISHDSTV